MCVLLRVCLAIISIHAPTRGATRSGHCSEYEEQFQSTLPRGERQQAHKNAVELAKFQSTLPRGERLFQGFRMVGTQSFQSTLPRGERPTTERARQQLDNFNPRSHEGSDGEEREETVAWNKISIHAPTRGATKTRNGNYWKNNYFNPRSHEGSDRVSGISVPPNKRFQSTLPRGERQQFSPKSSLFSQQKLSKIFNLNNKLF